MPKKNLEKRARSYIFIAIYLIFLIIFTAPFFLNQISISNISVPTSENYNLALSKINTSKKAYAYVDSIYSKPNQTVLDTQLYAQIASKFIKERFFHGLCSYSVNENWLAYVLGKYSWFHFSAIVNPNDILKYPEGICSQQTIVFIDILKHKKINTRTVELGYPNGPGHFLCEVMYNSTWHLYDVTMEPKWELIEKKNENLEYYLNHKDSIYLIYELKLNKTHLNKLFEKVKYGEIDTLPAKKMRLFHQITYFIIYLIPVFFLILLIRSFRRMKEND